MKISAVYRYYDISNNVIYIGKSDDVRQRDRRHCKASPWYKKVGRIDVEYYRSPREARMEERIALASEWPKYNKKIGQLHNVLQANLTYNLKVISKDSQVRPACLTDLLADFRRTEGDDGTIWADLNWAAGINGIETSSVKAFLEILRSHGVVSK